MVGILEIVDVLTKALFNLLLDKIVYHGIGLAAARRTNTMDA